MRTAQRRWLYARKVVVQGDTTTLANNAAVRELVAI
jgi:hypothetical protein